MNSMTGFGRGIAADEALQIKVYCNAVKWKSIFRYAIHGIGKKFLP